MGVYGKMKFFQEKWVSMEKSLMKIHIRFVRMKITRRLSLSTTLYGAASAGAPDFCSTRTDGRTDIAFIQHNFSFF